MSHAMRNALFSVLICLLGCPGYARAQDPGDNVVEYDPYLSVQIQASQLNLLPGEPPRVFTDATAGSYPADGPGCVGARARDTAIWIARPAGEWLRMSAIDLRGGAWAPQLVDPELQPLAITLHLRPYQAWPSSPAFAFAGPGVYLLRITTRVAFVLGDGTGRTPATVIHTTPAVASNALEFHVIEPPPAEAQAAEHILSHGWLSGTRLAAEGPQAGLWTTCVGSTWADPEQIDAFLARFPYSRYSDHIRLDIVRDLNPYGQQALAPETTREALESALRHLDAIRMEGFSQADAALRWRAVICANLGRQAEADRSWAELQRLPYPTSCKSGASVEGGSYPPTDPWYLRPERRGE